MRRLGIITVIIAVCVSMLLPGYSANAGPWGEALGGAVLGSVIGGIAGGGDGAAVGAVLGGGTGLAVGASKAQRRKTRAKQRQARYEKERLEWEKMRVKAELKNRNAIIQSQQQERSRLYNQAYQGSGNSSSTAARLQELDTLKAQGLITNAEYASKRAEILKGL